MGRRGKAVVFLATVVCVAGACRKASQTDEGPGAVGKELRGHAYLSFSPIPEKEKKQSGVTVHVPGKAFPGYNLFGSKGQRGAKLMTMSGREVHRWENSRLPRAWNVLRLDETGHLFVVSLGRLIGKLSASGDLVWANWDRFHHHISLAGDGTLHTLRSRTAETKAPGGTNVPVISETVVELTAEGKVKRSVDLHPLLASKIPAERLQKIERTVARLRKEGKRAFIGPDTFRKARPDEFRMGNQSIFDVYHPNTAERLPRDIEGVAKAGQILLSVRELDTVAILDLDEGRLVWEWGPGEILAQHQPVLTKDNTILLFDNGRDGVRAHSRVVEVDPRTNKVVWTYDGGKDNRFYSRTEGGVQELPNGNILVVVSNQGRAFEITRQGEIVWEYWNTDVVTDRSGRKSRAAIYRMTRVSEDTARPLLGAAK